jgi:hypothetical protein
MSMRSDGNLIQGSSQLLAVLQGAHCPASELNRGLSDFSEIQATISSFTRAKEEK